uniref:Uncharacterized protein n=1 Tax=Rhizophora mucronata TaxID=61149 RepID=A0A2P2PF70_RHIMU
MFVSDSYSGFQLRRNTYMRQKVV